MADLFKRNTISEKPLFGKFNLLYGDALVAICPLLNKFKIGVYTVAEYLNLPPEIPPIDDIQNQPFAFFLCKDGDNASATDVGIIYNVAAIHRIELTEGEEYASIAHEIGHILFF